MFITNEIAETLLDFIGIIYDENDEEWYSQTNDHGWIAVKLNWEYREALDDSVKVDPIKELVYFDHDWNWLIAITKDILSKIPVHSDEYFKLKGCLGQLDIDEMFTMVVNVIKEIDKDGRSIK